MIQAQQLPDPLAKRWRRLPVRQPGPMRAEEFLGNTRIGLAGVVNHHGQQESRVIRHVVQPPRGEMPFTAEVTLGPRVGVGRDQRYKQCAIVDLFLYLRIPRVAPAQFAAVEPHFDAGSSQNLADARRCLCILGGVGNEDCTGRARLFSHELALTPTVRGILAGPGRTEGNGDGGQGRNRTSDTRIFRTWRGQPEPP